MQRFVATSRVALLAGLLTACGARDGERPAQLSVDTLTAATPGDSTVQHSADTTESVAAPTDPGTPAAVPVRYVEGTVHGFLRLSTAAGQPLARGNLLQRVRGDTIESRMEFTFNDGSVFDERVVFTQSGVFRMLRYHLVQQGPAFATQLDARLDRSGAVRVKATESDGDLKEYVDTLELPADIYNGMPITIIKNLPIGTTRRVHLVAFTPKPRLIGLDLSGAVASPTPFDNTTQSTARFRMEPEVGGLIGLFAKLLDKIPPDSHAWIVIEDVPAFVRFEGPLYDGPIWRIDLTGPGPSP